MYNNNNQRVTKLYTCIMNPDHRNKLFNFNYECILHKCQYLQYNHTNVKLFLC